MVPSQHNAQGFPSAKINHLPPTLDPTLHHRVDSPPADLRVHKQIHSPRAVLDGGGPGSQHQIQRLQMHWADLDLREPSNNSIIQ